MMYPKLRMLIVVVGTAATLLAVCGESRACPLLDCLFGGGSRTTYKVAYPAPACPPAIAPSPCSSYPTPTCRYVPQTTYRPVIRTVPVTSSFPMVSRDPCTGCRVTTYRPVTTWTRQTTLLPYTTYRMVYTNPCVPNISCNPCGATVSCAGTTAGSSCSGCSVGTAGRTSVSYGGTIVASGDSSSTKTVQEVQKPVDEEEEPNLEPIPKATEDEADPGDGPEFAKPISRTTSLPVIRATYYRPAVTPAPPKQSEPESMIGVWRASRD